MKLWRVTPKEQGEQPFTVEAETIKKASELALPRLHGFGGVIEALELEDAPTINCGGFTPTINGQTGKG